MITKDMILLDIVEKHAITQDVFHQYDNIVGSCIMCEQLFVSLAEMSEHYGLDAEKLVKELNEAIAKESE
ncbi:MAG: hypothetical protein ABFD18_06895 [Syntrophomonas sp.]